MGVNCQNWDSINREHICDGEAWEEQHFFFKFILIRNTQPTGEPILSMVDFCESSAGRLEDTTDVGWLLSAPHYEFLIE
jgi:hypothetical protein